MTKAQEKTSREKPRDGYHHGDLRRALLTAAEAELTEKGIEGFSLRGCAKRAGVSHAAPAHHFGDADGLLTALAAEGFRRLAEAMRRRQGEKGERRPLDAAGLGYVDFATASPALFRLMFASSRLNRSDPDFLPAATEAFMMLADSASLARGSNALADGEGRTDIAAAWALAHGLADLLLSGRLDFMGPDLESGRDRLAAAVFGRLGLSAGPTTA